MNNPFLEKEEFTEKTFESLELKGASVEAREFENCYFLQCNFGGALFKRSQFLDCTFKNCDLSNTQIASGTFRNCTFRSCKLIGVNWTAATSISHLNFEKCILNYANFVGLDLRHSALHECLTREADFADANMSEVDCRATDFAGARFSKTNLLKADFRQALNYAIRPDDNKLKGARFSLPEATLLLYGLDIELDE